MLVIITLSTRLHPFQDSLALDTFISRQVEAFSITQQDFLFATVGDSVLRHLVSNLGSPAQKAIKTNALPTFVGMAT